MPSSGKIDIWLEGFPAVDNNSHCGIMDYKLFGKGFVTLLRRMGSSCFSKITAEVIPHWNYVNTHLNASDQQNDKISTFMKVVTIANKQLLKSI